MFRLFFFVEGGKRGEGCGGIEKKFGLRGFFLIFLFLFVLYFLKKLRRKKNRNNGVWICGKMGVE